MHRRDFIGKASLAAAALGASSLSAQTSSTKTMSYTLAPLPYPHAALEPHIDQATMEIHHGKHHATYVANLNKALESAPELASKSIEELISNISALPEAIRGAVRNNGGGHWNHTFFWNLMAPSAGGQPSGALAEAITSAFGSFDDFKAKFEAAGLGRFGSGWAWLCLKSDKSLCICSTPNQDNPLMAGIAECPGTPLLGCDVWEHAYYLKYQNKRADYITAWFNLVNWDFVAARYEKAMQ
jgi:Fe-Mn family superoxide dismutase